MTTDEVPADALRLPAGRRSALLAASRLLAANGLPTGRLAVHKDGSNLLVRPWPAPVILRVATFTGQIRRDPLPYLARELALVGWLAGRGAPVMGPSREMPPGPHVVDGWAMAAFTFEEHVPGLVPSPSQALAALDDLHSALRAYPGELPLMSPVAADLDLALRFAGEHGVLLGDEVALLAARRDELLPRLLDGRDGVQPLHGDAFQRNSVVTRDGRMIWVDLEDCCAGPLVFDHATLVRFANDDGLRQELVRRDGEPALSLALELREIQIAVWERLHDARRERGW